MCVFEKLQQQTRQCYTCLENWCDQQSNQWSHDTNKRIFATQSCYSCKAEYGEYLPENAGNILLMFCFMMLIKLIEFCGLLSVV